MCIIQVKHPFEYISISKINSHRFTGFQVFLIKGWERQQRVVIRDHQRNRTLSVPFYWPVRFRHKDNKLASKLYMVKSKI